ncbi:ArsR/SmtB family transcription factor [Janthinobacterium lividum]|jgi:ArsR family transcriptional regulator|uniref:ArsR/SmtB family transcription factor n=1 Tax=Janthinobacterium sp. LB2P10 TaxID=3424194 RepID=UPI00028A3818
MENEKTIASRVTPLTSASAIVALAALAQESRLAVFRLLVQAGPEGMAAMKIAEALAIAPSSLSFHLKELAHADLLTASKAGRSIIYAANYAGMNGLLAFLTENCCAGAPCCVTDSGHITNESTP